MSGLSSLLTACVKGSEGQRGSVSKGAHHVCKHKDLGLILRIMWKKNKPKNRCGSTFLSSKQSGGRDRQIPGAYCTPHNLFERSQASEKSCLTKQGRRCLRQDIKLDFWLLHACAQACMGIPPICVHTRELLTNRKANGALQLP